MEKIRANKKTILKFLAMFLAGVFWVFAMRFVFYNSTTTHYHANFAVFVEGKRLPLDSPLLYEEVQSCGGENVDNPKIRVHMHDQINHIIHVHDDGATWGHFFANIGMTNGDSVFRVSDKTYIESKNTKISFILNGEEVDTTANRTIRSGDALLVSIGNLSADEIKKQYAEITDDAEEYNQKLDPAGCSGGKELTLTERIKKAISFKD